MKKTAIGVVLAAAAALALGACGAPPTTTPSTATSTDTATAPATSAAPQYPDFIGCMVSDSGGFSDKSFNQSGWQGMVQAQTDLGIQVKQAESQSDADYAPNLANMQAQNCNLTITVGFLLADATKAQAEANPDSKFAIVDDNSISLPNVKPLIFKTSEAAFLAGYVAAAYSTTGTVATFGGMNIPTVSIFMDGFADGVAQYNTDSGKTVKVLGWDKATQNGSFTGDFEDQSKGQNLAQQFIAQGADVIMPVAGPVGLGAAAAAKTAGNVAIVWVDADGFETAPDYQDIFLTSVMKEIQASVFDTINATASGQYSATPYIGTLANGGVGIAPYHNFASKIPQDVQDKVEQLKQDIISGKLVVSSPSDPK
ncbi:MAG: BMP family ABC transporter substrate-binding protein [Propionibacteriaceae bacterium]|nr:BMP family ABC transporter substrate-binding protein [Propionibacteriaceae bacterium]